MLKQGVWVPEGLKVDANGEIEGTVSSTHRGFRLSALYSPWLTFSEIASKFLSAKDHVPSLLGFVNGWLGHIWEDVADKISPEAIAARSASYDRGTVPKGAVVLCAGVDVQKDTFYYSIRAFGIGERSWLVEAGRIETWEALIRHLFQNTFPGEDGTEHRVRMTCIDSGYRTDEVYTTCREWMELARPIKGQASISGVPLRAVKIDRDFSGSPHRGSIRLWHIDTSHFKDKLVRLQNTPDEQPGAWRIHRDPHEEYLRQVTSEHKVLKRDRKTGLSKSAWVPKPGGGPNHWLDTEVYCLAAADMIGVYTLKEEIQETSPVHDSSAPVISDQQHRLRGSGGSWVSGGGEGSSQRGWVNR